MRWFGFIASFLLLVFATCAMWAFRYQRVGSVPIWKTEDLDSSPSETPGLEWVREGDQTSVLLRSGENGAAVSVRLAIPGARPVEGLRLRFQMIARDLKPGAKDWEDGRFMIEWMAPGGSKPLETDAAGTVRHSCRNDPQDFVVDAEKGPAIPVIRLEHLGRSGEFSIHGLEITAVRERALWKVGRWFLLGGWFVLGLAFLRSFSSLSWWRAAGACMIWLFAGTEFVLPGPWTVQRAIYPEFRLEPPFVPPPSPRESDSPPAMPAVQPGPVTALGELSPQGSFALQVKLRIKEARNLLHILMIFGPSLLIALLAGPKRTLILMVILACMIELAQVAFGYGFDAQDVLDLACDAAGILIALWVARKSSEWWRKARPSG